MIDMLKRYLKFIKNAIRYIKNSTRISSLRRRGASIGHNVFIGNNCIIDNPKKLNIGNNVYIGHNFYANCLGKLLVDNGAIISNNCTIMTYNHDFNDSHIMPYGLEYIYKPVTIGHNVWIGINVNICPGVVIGEGSIIGMGTTVSKNIPQNVIYAGNRVIRDRQASETSYSLMELRNVYNPIHYLIFKKNIRDFLAKNNSISFTQIKEKYRKEDWAVLTHIYCEYHGLRFDLNEERITHN